MATVAADLLMSAHFLWVLFMVMGFPLAWWLRSQPLRWLHMLGLTSYLVLAAVGAYCPLTVAEEALRQQTHPDFTYAGSFLSAWMQRIIYVESWGAPLWIFRIFAGGYLVMCVSSWWWWPVTFKRKNCGHV